MIEIEFMMYDGDNDMASSLLTWKFKPLIMATFYFLRIFIYFIKEKHSDSPNSSIYYLTTNILSEAKQFLFMFFILISNCISECITLSEKDN